MTDTAFYTEMQELAQELLEDFGAPVTLTKEGSAGGGYDDFLKERVFAKHKKEGATS